MPNPSAPPARQVRCAACGRSVALTADDLLGYAGRRPWPACCGAAMDLLVGARRVSPADSTDPERPAFRFPGPVDQG
jgi:hypothetical protein